MVPITSNQGFAPTSMKLLKEDYPNILKCDSYLDFRTICVANAEHIRSAKGLDSNNKYSVILEENPKLNDLDIVKSDLAAIYSLEMGSTVQALVHKHVNKLTNIYKTNISNEFNSVIANVEAELNKIDNEDSKNLILAMLSAFSNNLIK